MCQEVEDDEKPQGFWTELFLLKPDIAQLRHILESTDGEYLIHLQVCTDRTGVCLYAEGGLAPLPPVDLALYCSDQDQPDSPRRECT